MLSHALLETPTKTEKPVAPWIDPGPSGSSFSARVYEPFLWLGERRGMRTRRRRLLGRARGSTLEIGAGTGLNVPHYPAAVDELVLAEPIAEMTMRIDTSAKPETRLVRAPAESIPFPDGSFDTIVSTMVLCTVQDPEAAMDEVQRLLRPGGRFLFCEHVRSESPRLARWQDRLAGPWAAFAEGCMCNRDTLPLIESRMDTTVLERGTWRGMNPVVHPLVVGEAVAG